MERGLKKARKPNFQTRKIEKRGLADTKKVHHQLERALLQNSVYPTELALAPVWHDSFRLGIPKPVRSCQSPPTASVLASCIFLLGPHRRICPVDSHGL
jgi:hypothetical protein